MTELKFESSNDYTSGGSEDVTLDVTFTHPRTGETLVRPASWDGGNVFLVRTSPWTDSKGVSNAGNTMGNFLSISMVLSVLNRAINT